MKNNILFVSSVCSGKVFKYIFDTLTEKSGNAIQKFHGLFLKGLAMQDSNIVETLSTIPVSPSNHKKKIWNIQPDECDNIKFNYVPIINIPVIKNFIVFLYSFFKVLFWRFPDPSGSKVVICDILKLAIELGVFCACKIRGIKLVAIVTDMPGLDVFETSIITSVKSKVIKFFLTRYDGYILITKHMNEVINPYKKPYIVMEGLVDNAMISVQNELSEKAEERILVYAGGIYERYGIKNLIEAFMKLNDLDLQLYIYGEGPMADEMPAFSAKDDRIKYMGVVSNEIVIQMQLKATLLINPRPSFEEFTKYSFPSKNMEYMVSGTPILTTLLPGMPEDYMPFVFAIRDENVLGIYEVLKELLGKSRQELHDFGLSAKDFVLTNKNNLLQGTRITSFLEKVIS